MKMKVPPHDLAAICIQFNTTLAQVAENIGIPEKELLKFAAGELALDARDRDAIVNDISFSSTPVKPGSNHPGTYEAYKKLESDAVFEELCQQVLGEDPEENG
jgi:hypothetical protein